MILSCPECKTKYRVRDELIDPEGIEVKCSRCGHRFMAYPDQDQETGPGESEQVEQTSGQSDETEVSEEPDRTDSGQAASFDLERRVNIKKIPLSRTVLLIVALLLVCAVGAVFVFPGLKGMLPFGESGQPDESVSRKKDLPAGNVEDIGLQDVRQYMVQNEKIGQVLVIEGKAVNNSQSPKEMIKIQATLFDAQGEILSQKEFLAGNTVSLFQLQVLSQDALSSALESRVGILSNNTDIAPEEDVMFMTTFTNPPDDLAEFSLKIVQARPVSD